MRGCFAYTYSLNFIFAITPDASNVETLRVIIALKDQIKSGPPLLSSRDMFVAVGDANCRSER